MPTSVPITPTITAAGLAAVFNAQSTGVEFELSHIAFGTAQYTPNGTETALQAEKVRVTIAGGGRISPTQIQIYAVAMAAAGQPFFVGEVGFFGNDGATLLAVYSTTATPNLFLSDTVATSVSYALGLAALPANSVTVTIDPSASAALLILGNHVAAADPHPQYVEKVNGVAFYDPTVTFVQGAEIIGDDLLCYQSLQANNIGHPPSSSPTWWVPLYNYGDTPVSGLTNASVTLSSTQAARAHITLSGALTANLNVIFPNWVKDWTVVNNTTGAFSVTAKTAAGTGIAIPQNGSPTRIRGDGTNITQSAENIAFGTQNQHAAQLGQTALPLVGQFFNLTATFANAVSNPIAIDQVVVADAVGGNVSTISNWNSTIATNVTGIGGMDTGTVTGLANVAIFAAWNPTTGAKGFFGQNVTAAVARVGSVYSGVNLPAGYTRTCLVAAVNTDSTGKFLACSLLDRHCTVNVSNQSSGQSPASNVTLQLGCPINARTVDLYATFTCSVATNANIAISGQSTGNMPVYSNQVVSGQSTGLQLLGFILTTLRTVYWTYSNSTGTPNFIIALNGWSI